MNTNEKKEWLGRYGRIVRKCENLNMQINIARQLQLPGGIQLSDMPKGTAQKDLSDYAVRFDRLWTDLQQAEDERRVIFFEIIDAVNQIENTVEAQMILKRYISLMQWNEICEETGYSRSACMKIHQSALESLNCEQLHINTQE